MQDSYRASDFSFHGLERGVDVHQAICDFVLSSCESYQHLGIGYCAVEPRVLNSQCIHLGIHL